MDYTERPLTPALSPSEGEREEHRQVLGVGRATEFPVRSRENKKNQKIGTQLCQYIQTLSALWDAPR